MQINHWTTSRIRLLLWQQQLHCFQYAVHALGGDSSLLTRIRTAASVPRSGGMGHEQAGHLMHAVLQTRKLGTTKSIPPAQRACTAASPADQLVGRSGRRRQRLAAATAALLQGTGRRSGCVIALPNALDRGKRPDRAEKTRPAGERPRRQVQWRPARLGGLIACGKPCK